MQYSDKIMHEIFKSDFLKEIKRIFNLDYKDKEYREIEEILTKNDIVSA